MHGFNPRHGSRARDLLKGPFIWMALVEDVDSVCGMLPHAGSVLNEWQLMNTSSETSVRLFSGG